MSYSQGNEEAAILAAFYERGNPDTYKEGRFLDIGAFHATQLSNTRALFEQGWSGVMMEPSPGPMNGLLAAYGNEPRITLIQAAVGIEPGLLPMHISGDALSTSEAANYELWKDKGGFVGKMLVPVVTFEQISNQFGGFDFVSIDVEGNSVNLFLRALALGWEPRCFCVEHDNRLAELLTMATGKGYVATMTNSCNVVLVKK